MSGIGNGNDNPALRRLDAIGIARGLYLQRLGADAKAALDELVRWFFAEVPTARELRWTFSSITSSGEAADIRHVGLSVEFVGGVVYEDESYYGPPDAPDEEALDASIESVGTGATSGALDELYHHLSDNLDVLSRIFPEAERVAITRPDPGAKFTYVVKNADDQTPRTITED